MSFLWGLVQGSELLAEHAHWGGAPRLDRGAEIPQPPSTRGIPALVELISGVGRELAGVVEITVVQLNGGPNTCPARRGACPIPATPHSC